MAVMKVKTDIIVSIAAVQTERAVILVIMYVETFKTDVIDLISSVMICMMSHWLIIFSIMVSPLILKISQDKIKGKMYKLPINRDILIFYFRRMKKIF